MKNWKTYTKNWKIYAAIVFAAVVLSGCDISIENDCSRARRKFERFEMDQWYPAWRDYNKGVSTSDKPLESKGWNKIFESGPEYGRLLKEYKENCGCK
ncbi:MAG: hypothetical protein FWC51_01330 [Proteobacteria bacterium]|nr:hypothetical protein [Pseudomonadota bacterium]